MKGGCSLPGSALNGLSVSGPRKAPYREPCMQPRFHSTPHSTPMTHRWGFGTLSSWSCGMKIVGISSAMLLRPGRRQRFSGAARVNRVRTERGM